jgi:hypothetical protein
MKKHSVTLILVTTLTLLAQSCSLPLQYVGFEGQPREEYPPEERPEGGFPPENQPMEEHPPEDRPPGELPPEEHPPEESGEIQITFFGADRSNIQTGECAMLEWNVQGGYGATINGEPVGLAGAREVCPPETTSYRLGVDTGTELLERETTIIVGGVGQPQPAGPQSTPQPPPTNKKITPTPTFTFGGVLKASTDLAVVDIYPDSSGKILVSIQNTGTTDVKENIKVKCQGLFTTQSQNQSYPLSNKSISVNLKPGQRGNYETGFARDPIYAAMVVSCEMTPPTGDTNNANNALKNKKVK